MKYCLYVNKRKCGDSANVWGYSWQTEFSLILSIGYIAQKWTTDLKVWSEKKLRFFRWIPVNIEVMLQVKLKVKFLCTWVGVTRARTLNLGIAWRQEVSFMPWPPYRLCKRSSKQSNVMLLWLLAQSGHWKRKLSCLAWDQTTFPRSYKPAPSPQIRVNTCVYLLINLRILFIKIYLEVLMFSSRIPYSGYWLDLQEAPLLAKKYSN